MIKSSGRKEGGRELQLRLSSPRLASPLLSSLHREDSSAREICGVCVRAGQSQPKAGNGMQMR
ncbi:hypothetical protein GBA52_005867 [Prunus armeniaca]|nr:hypothetical protein GBA52_005867 [Prunus armeniaca]